MKIVIITLLAITQLSLAEGRGSKTLPFRGMAGLPIGSQLSVVADSAHYKLTIVSQGTARPFWGMSEIRPPISTLWSAAPTISFVSEIGTIHEKRFTIIPRNLSQRRNGYTFTENLKIPLFVGDNEVGFATLFSKDGGVNTHKVVYTLERTHFSGLGDHFLVISGSPIAKLVTNNAEQGGADQPATAPESRPKGKEKPKPESNGRPQ